MGRGRVECEWVVPRRDVLFFDKLRKNCIYSAEVPQTQQGVLAVGERTVHR
jgi:hypothetical protein